MISRISQGFRHGLDSFVKDYEKYCLIDEKTGTVKTSQYTVEGRSKFNNAQKLPNVDNFFRSNINPSIFFVGFDHRRPTLTLGNQGWDSGVAVAKDLCTFNPDKVPIGDTSEAGKGYSYNDISPLQAVGLSAAATTVLALLAKKVLKR